MPSGERLRKLSGKLPAIRVWIEDTVASYRSRSTSVVELNLPPLSRYFSTELLQEAKTVHLAHIPPLPPLDEIGLEDASGSEEPVTYEAVTYGDAIFLRESLQSEVLYFHEIVHVIQWTGWARNISCSPTWPAESANTRTQSGKGPLAPAIP